VKKQSFNSQYKDPISKRQAKLAKRNNSVFVIATADVPQVTTEVLLT